MAASPRAFVLRHTRLRPVPGLEEIRLHLADEVLPLTHAVQIETDDPDAAVPYWAFAWAGGLAIGRYLREHPEAAAGRRVFDVTSGSGLCAIASMHAGAAEATGADIDAFAAVAIELNARANGRRVTVVRRDVLDEEPPDVDVILAGDCWYDAGQDDVDVGRLLVQDIATHDGHPVDVGARVELDRCGGEGIDISAGRLGRAGIHRRDRAQPGAGCHVEHPPTRRGLRVLAQVPADREPARPRERPVRELSLIHISEPTRL